MADANELKELCAQLVEVMKAAETAFTTVAAQSLAMRALIALLDARGILSMEDLREHAPALGVSDDVSVEVAAAIEKLLPDGTTSRALDAHSMTVH